MLGGIVQHDDRTVLQGAAQALHDRIRTAPTHAVVAARRPADERDAGAPRAEDGGEADVAERRAEEARARPGRGFDRVAGSIDLLAYRPRHPEGEQPIVAIAVYAERVPAGVNLADDVGIAAYFLAQNEEGRAVARARECCEHPSRGDRMGAVIKGERYARASGQAAEHD